MYLNSPAFLLPLPQTVTASPNEEARTLGPRPQLPWDSTWPDSSFWGVGILNYISYVSNILLPYSLAFLLTPATHPECDLFLWHCLHILTCPLNLAGSGCAQSRTQSLASGVLQAPAYFWPPRLPAQACSECPLYSEFPST